MKTVLSCLALLLAPAARAAEPEQVQLPLAEFLRLYEASKTRPDKPEAAPRPYALASARYVGEVVLEGEDPVSAVFTGRFRIENLREKDQWVRVPLLPATVAVRSARIGNAEAPLVLENGYYTLVTEQPGAFEVAIEFAVGVSTSEGSSGFEFGLVQSGATTLELAVPARSALDFTVANAKLQSDRTVGDRRVVTATLPSTGSLSVRWQREIQEAEKQEPRLYAEVHTLVGIGEGLMTARVSVQQTILFAGVDTLKFRIPAGFTVLDVEGAGLRDWAVDDAGVLTAQLNYAAEGAYPLVLDLERVLPPGSTAVEVPMVEPQGVERAKGFVGVQALGNLELASGAVEGAAPVDVRTLPATIVGVTEQPVLLGYKYLGATAKIPLTVGEHEEVDVLVTLLDQAQATTMFTWDGRRLTSVRYQVRNNRRQFLRLVLPDAAELWSASVAGRSVQPARSAQGELLVPLVRSQAAGGALAAFDVEVVYVESGAAPDAAGRGRFEATLPKADAPTTWVGWTVYAPDQAKIRKKKEGSLIGVEWLSRPASAAAYEIPAQNLDLQQMAEGGFTSGAMGQGAAPVEVTLPVEGQALHFEKLLALDERLWVAFDYRGLKRK